jgi:predicted MFS family arabinose efflux permease
MADMARLLIVAGVALVGVGVALLLVRGLPLGRFPGDVVWHRGSFTLYLPLGTSLMVSIVLTLAFLLLRRWR